jgi:hypothetical protein
MKIINAFKGLFNRILPGKDEEPVSPQYSYRIFWAKQALSWSLEERNLISKELEAIIQADDFEANMYIRRFKLDAFNGQKHAGTSLMVLQEVLIDLERIEEAGGLE